MSPAQARTGPPGSHSHGRSLAVAALEDEVAGLQAALSAAHARRRLAEEQAQELQRRLDRQPAWVCRSELVSLRGCVVHANAHRQQLAWLVANPPLPVLDEQRNALDSRRVDSCLGFLDAIGCGARCRRVPKPAAVAAGIRRNTGGEALCGLALIQVITAHLTLAQRAWEVQEGHGLPHRPVAIVVAGGYMQRPQAGVAAPALGTDLQGIITANGPTQSVRRKPHSVTTSESCADTIGTRPWLASWRLPSPRRSAQ
jgi:hypothetical protein